MEHYGYYHRTFFMSSELFRGYNVTLDIRTVDSTQDIIHVIKKRLTQLFQSQTLSYLEDEVNKRDFHIHSHSFEDILLLDTDVEPVYICDHNHCDPCDNQPNASI